MKKIALVILAICSLFPLYGCGDSNIDFVKDGTLSFDTSTTVGNVFDSYPYFESSEWSSFEDQQKRAIVQFEGELNNDSLLQSNAANFWHTYGLTVREMGELCLKDKDCTSLTTKVYLTVQFILLGDEDFKVAYVGTRLNNEENVPVSMDSTLKALYSGELNGDFGVPQLSRELKNWYASQR